MGLAIVLIILTILNLIIYHKIFNVYYFGGLGKGCFTELFWAFIVAAIEITLFQMIGGFIIIAIVVVAIIIATIYFVKKIYDKRNDIGETFDKAKSKAENAYEKSKEKRNNKKYGKKDTLTPKSPNVQVVDSENKQQERDVQKIFCTNCGTKILRTSNFCNQCGAKITYSK